MLQSYGGIAAHSLSQALLKGTGFGTEALSRPLDFSAAITWLFKEQPFCVPVLIAARLTLSTHLCCSLEDAPASFAWMLLVSASLSACFSPYLSVVRKHCRRKIPAQCCQHGSPAEGHGCNPSLQCCSIHSAVLSIKLAGLPPAALWDVRRPPFCNIRTAALLPLPPLLSSSSLPPFPPQPPQTQLVQFYQTWSNLWFDSPQVGLFVREGCAAERFREESIVCAQPWLQPLPFLP